VCSPPVAVPHYGDATGEINAAILEAFGAHGIVIPVPQHEVQLLGQGSPA
jgi:small-conductance mechanosensitive channel